VVEGLVKGDVTALGTVAVSTRGSILGDVSCKRLSVQPGAQLAGFYRVGPAFAPETGQDAPEED